MWRCLAVSLLAMATTMARTASADDGIVGPTIAAIVNATPDFIGSVVVNTLQSGLAIGSRRLVVLQDLPDVALANAPLVCGGMPAVIAHTPTLGSNGECFKKSRMPALKSNLSCTCLAYLNETATEWIFRFRPPSSNKEVELPPTLAAEEILEIDSSLIYGVGSNVKKLRLVGIGDKPVPLLLRTSPIPGTVTNDIAVVISYSKAVVEDVYIENVDFSAYEMKRGFVPTKVTNLTMRNCNLATVSSDFLSSLGKLERLDMSKNSLPGVYQDISKDTCVAAICPIKAMNLSENRIRAFPEGLLNLDNLMSLSLMGNKISNFTVSSDVFASLQRLKTLELDPISDCAAGSLATVATTKVCVYNATTDSASAPTPSPPHSSSNSYLMYGIIGGCLVVAVLVFALVKKRSCRSEDEDDAVKVPLDVYFDNTLSYDDTHPTISASLLNDPIVITNRIPYNEIRVANCISKGGFGLVYSGVYNRRRVAIKKIRPDRAGDIKMIEAFLREICLMATLHHPHIVEFVGVSWDSLRNLSAVTEFMERGDLREVLHGCKLRNTPLTWDNHKTRIALHIAEGMTYLHSLSPKVIHRDLKSKNVLLNSEMDAKLSDFGISRERNIEETHMTAGIGTSFWIAPEVLLGKDYDEHADIFSFGVVLSEIDTDDYPYWNASNPNVGNKAQENMILQMVASGAMRPSFSDSCPKVVLELADLCLQVDPANRPTAAEVAYKLQQIVQFMGVPSNSNASTLVSSPSPLAIESRGDLVGMARYQRRRSSKRIFSFSVATTIGIVALVVATITTPTVAQQGGGGGDRPMGPPPPGGGGGSPRPPPPGSGGSGAGGAQYEHPLINDLQNYVGEGEGMLIVMGSPADAPPPPPPPPGGGGQFGPPPLVCGGLPALMTKSSVSNGACFGPNVTTTLSCSCLTELGQLDEWVIRVTAPAQMSNASPPPTLPASTVLGISSILVFTLPSKLLSFSLIAETKQPLPIKIQLLPGPQAQSVTTPWLVRVPLNNELKTLDIANLDFGRLQLKSGFLPTAVENLSLRQCNLARLQDAFLSDFTELKSLDLSMNALDGIYDDLADASPSRSKLSALNLSGNAMTDLPIRLLAFKQLKSLDLSGNPIANFTVGNTTADALSALTVFKLTAPPTNATCDAGMWRQLQGARVCVPQALSSGQLIAPAPKETTQGYLIYIIIGGSVVIVVLIAVFVYKRHSWRRNSTTNKAALESLFESTVPFDDSQPTVNASLVNDPIIITNRIPYNDLRLANCISKGGFGLVYSGVYNRRRVAIKKIRPDRAGDIKMIEAFLREICLMATLHHAHIVEFVGVSWDSLRNLCAVTEFMDRGDLRDVLQAFKVRNTPLTWDHHKTTIAFHIADALTYLHSLSPKVIHRDLKSKNVLLNSEMEAKLSDFGISRERNIEETHMTAGIGTSFWIAPEVLLGKDYDEHADIFSFGVVLSEIDTDDYPYWNEKNPRAGGEMQQNAILQMVASGMLRPSFSDSCPPQILQLAEKCLQVEPDDRPTAAEIVYELQRFFSTLPPLSQRSGFSTSTGLG